MVNLNWPAIVQIKKQQHSVLWCPWLLWLEYVVDRSGLGRIAVIGKDTPRDLCATSTLVFKHKLCVGKLTLVNMETNTCLLSIWVWNLLSQNMRRKFLVESNMQKICNGREANNERSIWSLWPCGLAVAKPRKKNMVSNWAYIVKYMPSWSVHKR